MVFQYFDFIFVKYVTIKSDMQITMKSVNNVIKENAFLLKVSSLKQVWWYLG